MNETKVALICLGIFLAGFVVGALMMLNSDFQYKDASIETCYYANQLTGVINNQSQLLWVYTGTNYTKLGYLNCSLLKG